MSNLLRIFAILWFALLVSAGHAQNDQSENSSDKATDHKIEQATAKLDEKLEQSDGELTKEQRDQVYETWEKFAHLAEEIVNEKTASGAALESLRLDLVKWRTRFANERSINNTQIDAVKRQIEALGPKPEDGIEAPEVSKKREELNKELAELEAPVKKATLAYSRADELIRNIDQIVRERQTKALLELGPSPLVPANWAITLKEVNETNNLLMSGAKDTVGNLWQISEFKGRLPLMALFLVLGGLGIYYGRRVSRLVGRFQKDENIVSALWLKLFMLSVFALVLTGAGALLVIQAFFVSGIFHDAGEELLRSLRWSVVVFMFTYWVSRRVFPTFYLREPSLKLSAEERVIGRRNGLIAGLVGGYAIMTNKMSEIGSWTAEAETVSIFPAIVVGSYVLWRFSNLLKRHEQQYKNDGPSDRIFVSRLLHVTRFFLVVVAVAGVILGAIGYMRAAEALVFPMLWTAALLGLIVILQALAVEIYILITKSVEARQSLFPVMAGIVLFLFSLPIVALLWGARVQDLAEIWNKITEGFDIGGVTISPSVFVIFALIFTVGYTLTKLLQGALQNSILPRTRIDIGGRNAIVSGIGYVGIFLSAVVAITSAGIDLSSLAIVAGALSVGIGFGMQNIVSNFVSGIILLIERPISQGDWIEVGGHSGYVRRISVRSTSIETFDRTDVIVPNSDFISGAVTNYTRGNTIGRLIAPIGVAYGVDTKRVEEILREIAEGHPMILANPAPNVVFRGFGDSALNFEIRAILRDVNWVMAVHSELNHEIAKRFAEEGIEIPFPQRDIWVRSAEQIQPETKQVPEKKDEDKAIVKRAPDEPEPAAEPDADGAR